MKHLLLTTIAAVVLVGCGRTPEVTLRNACLDGNIEAVKQHIADGVDVNAPNRYGWTTLHFTENKEIAELLIAKGADLNAKDGNSLTPLDLAIQRKKTETADFLRKHGGKTKKELEAEGK